jgi:hypothetical protein
VTVHHHALGLTHHQLLAVGAVAVAAFLVAAWIAVKTLKLYVGLLFWVVVVVAAWGLLRAKNGS